MAAGRVRVASPSFEVGVHDQADGIFPGRDALVGVVEVFVRIAVVVMIVIVIMIAVVVEVGRVEFAEISFAQRNARIGFVFLIVKFVEPAPDRFVDVARRSGRTRFALRATFRTATFGRPAFR